MSQHNPYQLCTPVSIVGAPEPSLGRFLSLPLSYSIALSLALLPFRSSSTSYTGLGGRLRAGGELDSGVGSGGRGGRDPCPTSGSASEHAERVEAAAA